MRGDTAIAVTFGLPIDVADFSGTQQVRRGQHILRGADGDAGAQRLRAFRAEAGVGGDGGGDGGQGVDGGAAVTLDQGDGFRRLETRLQHQGGAMREGGGHRVGAAVRPKQRRREQHSVGRAVALALADVEAVFDDAVMRERHGFRAAAGAGGVNEDRVVRRTWAFAGGQRQGKIRVGAEFGVGLRTGGAGIAQHDGGKGRGDGLEVFGKILLAELVQGEQYPDGGVAQQPFQLGALGPGAESNHGGADDRRAEEHFQPFQPVVHQQADTVAVADAVLAQTSGDAGSAFRQIGIGDLAIPADDGGVGAVSFGLLEQQVGQGAAVWRVHRVAAMILAWGCGWSIMVHPPVVGNLLCRTGWVKRLI